MSHALAQKQHMRRQKAHHITCFMSRLRRGISPPSIVLRTWFSCTTSSWFKVRQGCIKFQCSDLLQLHDQLVLLHTERLQPRLQLLGALLPRRRLARQPLRLCARLRQPPLPLRGRCLMLLHRLLVLPEGFRKTVDLKVAGACVAPACINGRT